MDQFMTELQGSIGILKNPDVVGYLLGGLAFTLGISCITIVLSVIIGAVLALVRNYCTSGPARILQKLASAYIELFRNTPLMLWMFVCFVMCPAPNVSKGFAALLGFTSTVAVKTLFKAIVAFTLFTSAIMAEIIRGGLNSVAKGQFEAAHAIGMTHWQTMTTVVLPQAIRNILPSVGNELIVNIKDSSVLNVISVSELFFQAKSAAGAYYRYFEVYFIIAVIYLILTLTVSRILRFIEQKMDGPDNYVIHGSQSDSRAEIVVSRENAEEVEKRWNQ